MGKSSALLSATAKHSESHLDKATHYLLNSDSAPDKCTDLIWLLDVQQPDHELLPTKIVSPTFSRSGPFLKAGVLLSYRNIFYNDSCPSRGIQTIFRVHRRISFARTLCSLYSTHLDHTSLPLSNHMRLVTRHHEQAEVDSAGFPPLISSNPPSKHWRRGGKKGRTGDAGLGCML